MQAIKNYVQNAVQELNHVTWPTKPQILRISIIVISFIFISAIVLGVVDYGLTAFYTKLLSLTK